MNRLSPKPGDVVVERYLLLDRPNPHKPVFRAVHLATERTVLLQYLVPEILQGAGDADGHIATTWRPPASHEMSSLMSRVRLFSRLDHPALLPIHDAGVDDPWPFVVRGLVQGQTLAEHLTQRRPTPRELITWVLIVTSGLTAARCVGLIHRDLRPENILLAKRSQQEPVSPYLVDFGLGQLGDAVDPRDLLSPQRAPYRAPERLRPHHGFREPGDVYALAAIVHEGLTGRLARPTRRAPRGAAGDWPATVPSELAELVMRCLSSQPGRRLQTLSAWSGALSTFVMEGGILARDPAAEPVASAQAELATTPSGSQAEREPTGRRVVRERRVIQSIRPSSAPAPASRLDLAEADAEEEATATSGRTKGRRGLRERRVIQSIRPSSPASVPAPRLDLEDDGEPPAPEIASSTVPSKPAEPSGSTGRGPAKIIVEERAQSDDGVVAESAPVLKGQSPIDATPAPAKTDGPEAEAVESAAAMDEPAPSSDPPPAGETDAPPVDEARAGSNADQTAPVDPDPSLSISEPAEKTAPPKKPASKETAHLSKRKAGRTAKRKAEAAKRKAERKAEAAKRKAAPAGSAPASRAPTPAPIRAESKAGSRGTSGKGSRAAVVPAVVRQTRRVVQRTTSSVGVLGAFGSGGADAAGSGGARAVVWLVGATLVLLLTVYALAFSSSAEHDGAERNVPILLAP